MYKKNKLFHFALCILIFLSCFFIIRAFSVYKTSIRFGLMHQLQENMVAFYSPLFSYMNKDENQNDLSEVSKEIIKSALPIYMYSDGYPSTALSVEDKQMIEQILLSEARDEYTEAVLEEEQISIQTEVEKVSSENQNTVSESNISSETISQIQANETESPIPQETDVAAKPEKVQEVDLEELKNFETLLSKYYVLDGTTIDEEQLNVSKLLSYDMKLTTTNEQPQILIYHTHSQEGFVDSDMDNPDTTIVGAGEKLAEILKGYGFNVIHDTGEYDVPSRDNAYAVSAPAIEEILANNPSIEVIIDLHRDGVAEGTHLVTDINGKPTAQFMFFNGLSRTKARGDIDYLKNENIDENLAFSFQAQLIANQYYPGLARKIYLKGYRFNMHYRGKSLLIELGAQTNTVEEIMNAIDPIANIIKLTLTQGFGEESEG